MTQPNVLFQIIIDSENLFMSQTADKKRIRTNITGIKADQIPVIVDAIIDAGPEAVEYFKKVVKEKIGE